MKKILLLLAIPMLTAFAAVAQSSMPAPGGRPAAGNVRPMPGGNSAPAPGGVAPSNLRPAWGSPWGPAYGGWGPGMGTASNPNWQNNGVMNVVACGYDAQGVWRVLPLRVSYSYNGIQYNVNVLNAWNPWTSSWDDDVDVPAMNTSYYLRGQNYNFYVVLSTGTFYFNL